MWKISINDQELPDSMQSNEVKQKLLHISKLCRFFKFLYIIVCTTSKVQLNVLTMHTQPEWWNSVGSLTEQSETEGDPKNFNVHLDWFNAIERNRAKTAPNFQTLPVFQIFIYYYLYYLKSTAQSFDYPQTTRVIKLDCEFDRKIRNWRGSEKFQSVSGLIQCNWKNQSKKTVQISKLCRF